jgi:hypothetical protein
MKSMKLRELLDMLIEREVVDPTVRQAIPITVHKAFTTLGDEYSEGGMSDDRKRTLYECAVLLTETNFRGSRGDAQDMLLRLTAENPQFNFRPTQDGAEDDPILDPGAVD